MQTPQLWASPGDEESRIAACGAPAGCTLFLGAWDDPSTSAAAASVLYALLLPSCAVAAPYVRQSRRGPYRIEVTQLFPAGTAPDDLQKGLRWASAWRRRSSRAALPRDANHSGSGREA